MCIRDRDNNGQVLTRMQIIDYVWKDSEEIPYDRVIDVYIKELRKKLQLDLSLIHISYSIYYSQAYQLYIELRNKNQRMRGLI